LTANGFTAQSPATIKEVFATRSMARAGDFVTAGISPSRLRRAVLNGSLQRLSRGVYAPAQQQPGDHWSLREVAVRAPNAVVCLLSALAFHGVTTQQPHEVWIAIEGTAWAPRVGNLRLRVLRFSGQSFRLGIETHVVEGVPIRVYSLARTVADCFRMRNKIGLEVAMEALREALRSRKVTRDQILEMARGLGVARVIIPYMEMEAGA
jgi:predicted transcriptional regulator of viral defense system